MRIGMVVPVPYVPGEQARWSQLAHRYIPLAHAEAQARRGHEVQLFFDGPPRRVDWTPGVTVHVSSGALPAFRGALRSPHLVQAALRTSIDVLHLHHLLNLESLWPLRAAGLPVFAEYHGGAPPKWQLRRRLLRRASETLAGAFFPASHYRRSLVAAGAWHPSTPLIVSPETTSRLGALRGRVPSTPASPRVLVVGRCEAPKDPLATVATLSAFLRRAGDCEVIWATPGGRDTADVQQALTRLEDLRTRVEMRAIPFESMAQTYAWADVTLATSAREIGATVLSESLSQGTPLAAFSLPTFKALAKDCEAVRLVEPRDPVALAEAALELARAPELRVGARQHFESQLSFDVIAQRRARHYVSALGQRSGLSSPASVST